MKANFVNDISSTASGITDAVLNESDESRYFEMVVRNIKGEDKVQSYFKWR